MKRLLFASLCLIAQPVLGGDLERLGDVSFKGEVLAPENISAIAVVADGEYLVIGGDEGLTVQVLHKTGQDEYTVETPVPLVEGDPKKEVDIEGIARSGDKVYVIGSHSRKRSKVEPRERTRKDNLKRLEKNKREELRENLFRFRLSDRGEVTERPKPKSLRDRIKDDPVLSDFLKIPSKENGIDIEGIASDGDDLFVGFRGPVLRDGYVPVLVFDFENPDKAKTRYVNLGGRGIRDIARVRDGFLLIGGPVGSEPLSFEVYFWDGRDCVGGTDSQRPFPKSLGTIPLPCPNAKAEGLAILDETDTHYDVLIVFDGLEKGKPTKYRVDK